MEQVKLGAPMQEEYEIQREDMGFEFMLNTLRLHGGFDPNLFSERTGLSINAIDKRSTRQRPRAALPRLQDHQADRVRPALPQ
jgi:oxygen-independent coproporphyrinogen-3 oxidase